jgi:hypothetical protein
VIPVDDVILTAGLSLLGTLIGTFGGIITGSKLTNYRLEKLEKTVDKHNNMIERVYKLEGRMNEAEHDIKDIKGRI